MNLVSSVSLDTWRSIAPRVAHSICAALMLCVLLTNAATAQYRFSKTYDTRPNVKLDLENVVGSVRVEVWQQSKIEVRADMERKVRIVPVLSDSALVINVLRDNGGMREDIGIINFTVHVPVNSSVALKTLTGDIKVYGVRGDFVRASVTFEGDIELVDINVGSLSASNKMGNIFFGGVVRQGGSYILDSRQGDININIPTESRFDLTASAPLTRRIELGPFARHFPNPDGQRRLHGAVGGGGATLAVSNTRGTISFRR